MLMDIVFSKNKVPIRLTDERWYHISVGHPEISDLYYDILETIENPFMIYEGSNAELIAVSSKNKPTNKFIVVVYKETSAVDGFVITAYSSNKPQTFLNKRIVWKQEP
jgi:hypothetical protein